MISERDVQAYKRDGVIMVPDVLAADTLGKLRSVIAELVAGSAQTLEHTDVYDLEPGHTAESPRVRRIKTPHKVHALFDQIVRSTAVLDILKKLIGPGLRLHGSKLNMKSAHYGSPVEWHQDWAFYPHTNDDILAIGVLLDDTADRRLYNNSLPAIAPLNWLKARTNKIRWEDHRHAQRACRFRSHGRGRVRAPGRGGGGRANGPAACQPRLSDGQRHAQP